MSLLETIAAALIGIILAKLIMMLREMLRVPSPPDPLDAIVSRDRWDVWRAAEHITRAEQEPDNAA